VLRYDGRKEFTDPSAWAKYDFSALAAGPGMHPGVASDGCYFYVLPAKDGPLTRYDLQGDFADARSWSAIDLRSLNPNARRFFGASFDGRYLYLTPDASGASNLFARFDARYPPAPLPGYQGSFF
jgi:hypothetical protein